MTVKIEASERTSDFAADLNGCPNAVFRRLSSMAICSTVYGIVKESGGHIFVQSELGSGTTCRIYLPVTASSNRSESPEQASRPTDLHGGETILVVEDNPPLRRLVERILRSYGYQVLVAANGTQAQRICTDHPDAISAILTDVIMPDESGPALAEWICARWPGTRALYMSGYAGDHRIFSQGHAFLQKPFSAKQLVSAIRSVLASPNNAGSS